VTPPLAIPRMLTTTAPVAATRSRGPSPSASPLPSGPRSPSTPCARSTASRRSSPRSQPATGARSRARAGGRDARPATPVVQRGALPLQRRAEPARAQRVAHHGRVRPDLPLRRVGPPSLGVFRHFLSLCAFKLKGWYFFRDKDAAGALFTGLPTCVKA
jgi:hypothetical protein